MTRQALVVEDEDINTRVLSLMLKRLGYEVVTAVNGQIASDMFRAAPQPAVVLMDLQLPELNGFDSVQLMRAWEEQHDLPHTPIVAVTARLLEGTEARAYEAGVDDFITKPIMLPRLQEALVRLVKPEEPKVAQVP